MTKVQIKSRYTDEVIYECEVPEGLESGMHTRHALEMAAKDGVDLTGANLYGADLSGADLAEANLYGANLSRANLAGANLYGANLSRANLAGANLAGANLAGADLSGAKLIGDRPVFQIGPIGSRSAYFIAYLTDQGIKLRTGCFFGTVDEFRKKLADEHGTSNHAKEYEAALALIECHAAIWSPEQIEEAA